MSEAIVPESVTIAAVPERVGLACAFVAGVLGETHPHNDLAVLLVSDSLNLAICLLSSGTGAAVAANVMLRGS